MPDHEMTDEEVVKALERIADAPTHRERRAALTKLHEALGSQARKDEKEEQQRREFGLRDRLLFGTGTLGDMVEAGALSSSDQERERFRETYGNPDEGKGLLERMGIDSDELAGGLA